MVTQLTATAVLALCVMQAFETGTGAGVAGAGVHHVDVAVALAWETLPSHLVRIAIVTRGTLITPGT